MYQLLTMHSSICYGSESTWFSIENLFNYSTLIDIHETKRWRGKLILVGTNWQDAAAAIHTTTKDTCNQAKEQKTPL